MSEGGNVQGEMSYTQCADVKPLHKPVQASSGGGAQNKVTAFCPLMDCVKTALHGV